MSALSPRKLRVLPFTFHGYTIWAEMAETDDDWSHASTSIAQDLDLFPIQAPHVTMIYGVPFEDQDTAVAAFARATEDLPTDLAPFSVVGITCDTELAGVGSGKMDMVWAEITLKPTPEHIDLRSSLILKFCADVENAPDTSSWHPHMSIAYDIPDGASRLTLPVTFEHIRDRPTLLESRKIERLSLWDMNGSIDQWQRLASVDVA